MKTAGDSSRSHGAEKTAFFFLTQTAKRLKKKKRLQFFFLLLARGSKVSDRGGLIRSPQNSGVVSGVRKARFRLIEGTTGGALVTRTPSSKTT